MKEVRQFGLFIFVSLLLCSSAWAATINVPGDQPTIQAAITAAAAGDTVDISAGTYFEAPVIQKSLTLQGAGQGVTIIDANASSYVGIHADGNYAIVLKDFSLDGPTGANGFGIMSAGENQSITIHDVTVYSCQRTAITLNGVSFGDIQNVTCSGTVFGVGFATSDCDNVTINGLTTFGNAWAGSAVYTGGGYFTAGSSNITYTGTLSFAESVPIYTERDLYLGVRPPINNLVVANSLPYLSSSNAVWWITAYYPSQAAGVAAAAAGGATGWTFDRVGDFFYVTNPLKIQAAIDAAAAGDEIHISAGRFAEVLHINKHVDLIGVGSGASDLTNTVIEQSGVNNVFFLEASGASNADPILFKDLRVEPVSRYAFETQNLLNLSFLKFDNVKVVGGPATIENLVGLRTASDASLHHVVIQNCEFTNLDYGFYFAKANDWGPGGSNVTNFTVTNTSISGNYYKGIYAEKLSDASFTGCTFSSNGSTPMWNDAWNGGVDINLKGPEGYQNITFDDCEFANNGLGFKEGAGLMVKARDDGATYGAHPATLNNVLITNCTFTGNERGLRFGEPTKNNLTPTNAVVLHNEFCNNVKTYTGTDGSAYGDLVNWTRAAVDAQQNYWCSTYLCDFAQNIVNGSTGSVDYSPWCDATYTNCNLALTVAYVDDDWAGSDYGDIVGGTHIFGCDAFDNLQDAANAVSGSDIYLAAGTYPGQTVILNHVGTLNIWGAGKASTFLTAVPNMTHMLPVGSRKPILSIEGSAAVNLHDLTIDGDGLGNTNNSFVGVAYWNSGGSMDDCDVLDVRDTPFSGAQHGVAVYVSKLSGDPARTVNLSDMTISGFQKNASAFNGTGITVNCNNVTVVGAGATATTAQNGLQYYLSTGTVSNCSLSGIAYTGAGWSASTLLLWDCDVDVDNTDLLGCHVGVYGYDAEGSFTNGMVTATASATAEAPVGVLCYSTAALARSNHPLPSPVLDEFEAESRNNPLDANETFVVNNAEVIGNGSLNSIGVWGYIEADNLDFTLTNSTVRNWYYGVDLTADGGTISPAVVTGNAFMNLSNTYDNTAGHNWNNNCYSDLLSNPSYPDYLIGGPGANVDLNPNPNPAECNAGSYVLTSDHIGCEIACIGDTLYLTFDQVGYVAAQIFVQLPPELDAAWLAGNAYNNTFPGSNVATNLNTSAGRRSAGNQIEVNVSWAPPYSDGDGSKYIACIPIKNVGATGGETLTISTGATTFYYNDGNTTSFDLGTATLYVDCMDPVTSIAYTVAPTCDGYSTATAIENLFTVGVLRGTTPPNAQLASAYVEVNGIPAQQVVLFNTLLVGDYSNAAFPNTGDAATIWGWLNEGCNSLVVHAFDAECNEGTATINLTKDTDAPDLTITNTSSFCYNNVPGPNYGGSELQDYLDISTVLNSNSLLPGCYAQIGTMEISYLAGTPWTENLDVTNYPTGDDTLLFWNWIVSQVPGANGGNYTFDVEVCDCAGNCATGSFTICIDLTAPANTFTLFNARPSGNAVWLQWAWTYNMAPAYALKAEIWRSVDSGEYPEYATNMWSNLAAPAYYPVSYPPAGYTLVATQLGAASTTSNLYNGLNGKGFDIQGGPGGAYWRDEDASWVTDSEDRDIYRYVTFVQDGGGNWSAVGSYSLNVNADRSTNYWLGDYSPDSTVGGHVSDGAVTSFDRSMLSTYYFTSTVYGGGSSPNFYDIGYENAENGVGKGIPTPDGLVNFSDLVPFSFNYGTTGMGTFAVPNLPPVVFTNLDELPSLSAVISADKIEASNSPIYVDVALGGNDLDALKVFEAQLGFDSRVIEFVGVTIGDLTVLNGEAWSNSHCVESVDAVVIAGAALGESAVINGDQPVARAEFRWISETVGNTQITLGHVRLADASGVEMPGPDVVLTLNNTSVVPITYSLSQNYPNPFNPATTIRFTIPEASVVKLSVYNILGQSVRTLVNETMEAGIHEILWDGRDNSGQSAVSGVYIYRIQANGFVASHKMMLTR